MSNVYVDNKNVKVSCSPFSIYKNEETILDFKDKFEFKYVEIHKITAFDKELLNAIYKLRYSTSRQLTEYLNSVRGIEVHQRDINRILTNFKRQKICLRYSFKSDERENETGLKAYALDENGRNILKSTPFGCNWVRTDSYDTENVKKYLARNQFILKFAENFSDIEWSSKIAGVSGSFTHKSIKYNVVPVRRQGYYGDDVIQVVRNLEESYSYNNNNRIIFIAEDDQNAFEIFKVLVKNKLMSDNVIFTQDNRVFQHKIDEAFIKFKINSENGKTKVELQQCNL